MIIKHKNWDNSLTQLSHCWERYCNKCGWMIDVMEPTIFTQAGYGQRKFYHEWCHK